MISQLRNLDNGHAQIDMQNHCLVIQYQHLQNYQFFRANYRLVNLLNLYTISPGQVWCIHTKTRILLFLTYHKHAQQYHWCNLPSFVTVDCTPIFVGVRWSPSVKFHPRRPTWEQMWTQWQWHRNTTKHVEQHDYSGQTRIEPQQTRLNWWDTILPIHHRRNQSWSQHFPSGVGQRDMWRNTGPIPRIVWCDSLPRSRSFFLSANILQSESLQVNNHQAPNK